MFNFVLYADDTTLTCTLENLSLPGNDITDAMNIINNELDQIYIWLLSNKLSLNVSKTNILRPGTTSSTIKPEENYDTNVDDSEDYNDSSKAIEEIENDLF